MQSFTSIKLAIRIFLLIVFVSPASIYVNVQSSSELFLSDTSYSDCDNMGMGSINFWASGGSGNYECSVDGGLHLKYLVILFNRIAIMKMGRFLLMYLDLSLDI
jgi:hypothetical protein